MRYFIAYLFKGRLKEYHEKISLRISKEFGIQDISSRQPAHLTLKAPFEISNQKKLVELEQFLKDFCEKRKTFNFKMQGFGQFRNNVIFLDGELNKHYSAFWSELLKGVKEKFLWIPFARFEGEKEDKHLHATLAYAKFSSRFKKIWDFLAELQKKENPAFNVEFDSVAILRRDPDKWRVYKEFKLVI